MTQKREGARPWWPSVKRAANRFGFVLGLAAAVIAVMMFFSASTLLLGLSWTGQVVSKPTCAAPKVKVLNGTYAGLHSREFKQDFFLGIPYAKVCLLES